MLGLLARKVGMTQVFDDDGNLVPVTVIRVDANTVIAQKQKDKDGYDAVLLGVDDAKESRVSKPCLGQYPEGIKPKKHIKEFRNFGKECNIGDSLGEEILEGCRYIDVRGISKGKGFQGVVKRWGFGGGRASHGSKFHREPGSTGQSTYPHKTFKNVKLPGRMGRESVTELSLRVVKIDKTNHLLLVRGAVPGVNNGIVVVRPAVKKQRA
ncbi:MAG: 50S ribosomal protein L3 [Spirochaetaceae bacterium]|jgi:large subunit ribosomal protein L3|nr:50S ribosomal protein L3 [Spirochaetaceae bacterium]GMO17847.1 MAG: 50S ribosomal protein L3 [Termitinemataceae bacterium]